jgi:hypothetical protein
MGSGSRCSLGLKVQDLRIDLRNGLVDRVVIRIFICEDYVLLFVMLMFDLDLCLIVGVCDIPPCKDHYRIIVAFLLLKKCIASSTKTATRLPW